MGYNDNKPSGCDTADCNGAVNLTKAGAPVPAFWMARAGIASCWKDSEYLNTRRQADKLGIPFIAYHVPHPGEPIAQQVKDFLEWAGSGCFGYCGDFEVDPHSVGISKVAVDSRDYTLALLDAGKYVVNYSSPFWIKEYFTNWGKSSPAWLNQCDWIIAQYLSNGLEHPGPVEIPAGIDPSHVWGHQSWNKMPNVYGSVFDSKYLDRDRYLLSKDLPGATVVDDEPETVPDTTTAYATLTVVPNGLHIRKEPCRESDDLGMLLQYAQIKVTEAVLEGDNIWWKRLEGGYCAQRYDGWTYLK